MLVSETTEGDGEPDDLVRQWIGPRLWPLDMEPAKDHVLADVALLAQGEDNAVVVRTVRVPPPTEVVHDDREGAA